MNLFKYFVQNHKHFQLFFISSSLNGIVPIKFVSKDSNLKKRKINMKFKIIIFNTNFRKKKKYYSQNLFFRKLQFSRIFWLVNFNF